MPCTRRRSSLLILFVVAGCSSGTERFEAPDVDHDAAAAEAVKLYDSDGDGALSEAELKQCPGVLGRITSYDKSGNGIVEQEEVAAHLKRLLNGTGGTQLSAIVTYKGAPLKEANVVFDPEPYLGGEVQAAKGVTDASGSTRMAIPPEFVPEHVRKLEAVHYGTFKVRITHPSIAIPAKYNSETELGYETEVGRPTVRFDLK